MGKVAWRFSPAIIDEALDAALPELTETEQGGERVTLRRAMRHAVLGGGKRLRSQLTLEAASVVGGADFAVNRALPAACALEMIHAYSLVHDDLPAMDNADTRRGRPSCHRAFGEALAILAGDALLTMAFEMLAGHQQDESWSGTEARNRLRAIRLIARAAGEAGMAGGQAIDIAWSSAAVSAAVSGAALLEMHALKTGALIRVAAESGALLGGGDATQIAALRDYGAHLGRAFQITDDVLDAVGDPEYMGKAASDAANGKATASAIFGLARSRQLAAEASEAAIAALRGFGDEADALRHLAEFVVQREK
jgi:geranylgeranyl diphosphate synthase, type II